MKKKIDAFWIIAYGYILLPFLIFAIGWMKWYISYPTVAILCICFYKACRESPQLWRPEWNRDNIIKFLFMIGIIAIWVYYSGIGKFVFQATDHSVRNSVFNIMVEYQWPVINYEILPESPLGRQGASAAGLIYYIGFWLPSALVGKVLGIRAGYYAQAVWAVLGIALVYYLICVLMKRVAVWPLFVFIFFSGLDVLGIFLTAQDPATFEAMWHLEWWGTPYEYSSMTTQLFWVFNQSIPAWVCTMLAYIQKNNRNLVFILACSMLSSTFPFVGLLLLVLFFCFTRQYEDMGAVGTAGIREKGKKYMSCLIKDTCTIQNVIGGGLVGIMTFLYLSGNYSGAYIMGENTRGPSFDNSLAKLVIFLILEIGIYAALIYKYNKENKIFYFILVCLCVFPPIKVGYSVDFCMRASIPALLILMLLVMKTLADSWEKKDYRVFVGLLLVLVLGGITPTFEFKRTISETFRRINEGEIVYESDSDPIKIMSGGNFSGSAEDGLFFKYFVKPSED